MIRHATAWPGSALVVAQVALELLREPGEDRKLLSGAVVEGGGVNERRTIAREHAMN